MSKQASSQSAQCNPADAGTIPLANIEQRPFNRECPAPRRTQFAFGPVPRHWHGGRPVCTHFFNAINIFGPPLEDFFIRVIKATRLHAAPDAGLSAQLRGFVAQEATHSAVHTRFLTVLREQGYAVDGLGRMVRYMLRRGVEQGLGPHLGLATVAGLEHLIAVLSEIGIANGVLDDAHAQMRALWLWHAAEELEHRSIAFDVLRAVNPSYALRIAGLLIGVVLFVAFLAASMLSLLRQDRLLHAPRTWHDAVGFLLTREKLAVRALWPLLAYLRPNFHPLERDVDALGARILL